MFGCCALVKFVVFLGPFRRLVGLVTFLLILVTGPAMAASQKGLISSEETYIFKEADPDSDVLAVLPPGKSYDISTGKLNGFYKIRLKPGMIGWVNEMDIKVDGQPSPPKRGAKKTPGKKTTVAKKKEATPQRPSTPLHLKRFRGLALESVNFTEDTMGQVRSENLLFYGFKWSGNNTFIEGEVYTDTEILFHSGAPKYYETATGKDAGGFILMGNFLFQTDVPFSRKAMAFYGFGPAFRYSHFEATLDNDPSAGKTRSYALEDMTVGAVFNAGVAFAIARSAVRMDLRYYWEIQRYTSLGLAFQLDF